MTKEEREEYIKVTLDNVLIAKYMGLKPMREYSSSSDTYYYIYNDPIFQDYEAIPDYREYENLMKVVEAINLRDWVTIKASEVLISPLYTDEFDEIIIESEDFKQNIFDAVLMYVNWIYNSGEK